MGGHEHSWAAKPEVSLKGVFRYRCECGAWGWRSADPSAINKPIREYAGGRSFDGQPRDEPVSVRHDSGGRSGPLPSLDDYDKWDD